MTVPTERLEPGYYLCVPKGDSWPYVARLEKNGEWWQWDDRIPEDADPRTLGYTIHYLPDLLPKVDRITIPRDLLASLVDDSDCYLDHHGGCQEHGYISLKTGEICPHAEAKEYLKATPHPDTTTAKEER